MGRWSMLRDMTPWAKRHRSADVAAVRTATVVADAEAVSVRGTAVIRAAYAEVETAMLTRGQRTGEPADTAVGP